MSGIPMRFNSLVLQTTSRCNARCAMCYQSVGPRGSELWGIQQLEPDLIERVVREARSIPTLVPRLHFAGGEAFLDIEGAIRLVELGKKYQYEEITCTTNCYWGVSEKRASEIAERLRDAGMTGAELSWDHWHKPYITPERMRNVIVAMHRVGILITLRILTSRKHSVAEALGDLDGTWELADRIITGPVFNSGRANREINPDELYGGDDFEDTDVCHSYLNLTVTPTGDVFPCCAGMDMTDNYQFGSAKQESIRDIAERMIRNSWLRQLVFDGVASFDDVLDKAGVSNGAECGGMCGRCWKVFSNPDATDAIVQSTRESQRSRIQQGLDALRR